ncbi:hypothetical protein COCMIDRAFT_108598 [Bipolaris oryzae ATCC 44560]|uniref:Major facilitator superfamily (MFS) profile domain-containing protein n=1 Tax=Bipolaris oryzae ATCC 44560 TaxID=930090 RepID=W6YSB9_COCMI|nr:uncharacterized protein COCMIDRAFT_108598 [Bipolaris oryzae ATCC 44560]EUC40520.1 hypothetical protein COCMIDRAFT_108598 [Bipolaris oryzae ATCC 44560]
MTREETALLSHKLSNSSVKTRWNVFKLLSCVFLISLSFILTQVPMLMAFRLMVCEEYDESVRVGCNAQVIQAETAKQVMIAGVFTVMFSTINLLNISKWGINNMCIRNLFCLQTFVSSIRFVLQIYALNIGAETGVMLYQATQILTVFGGPAGYQLVMNMYASHLVEPEEYTAIFGKLQGCIQFGTACGYLMGGVIGNTFTTKTPFQVAFVLMASATLFARFALPYVSIRQEREEARGKQSSFFGPIRMFLPPRAEVGGVEKRYWGATLLGLGVFCGVVANGYIPTLMQMHATNSFGFRMIENGYLTSFYAAIRGTFLIFAFPSVISNGRKWLSTSFQRNENLIKRFPSDSPAVVPSETSPLIGESTGQLQQESRTQTEVDVNFDLYFLRYSMILDGILTASAGFAKKGWHMYAVASLIPLASGTAPAARGVIVRMYDETQRMEALNAISIVDIMAKIASISIFGMIFSALSKSGISYLVFFCNAVCMTPSQRWDKYLIFAVYCNFCCSYTLIRKFTSTKIVSHCRASCVPRMGPYQQPTR